MTASHAPRLGIMFMILGMFCISLNDMLIKALSDGYALHQIVFLRNGLGILVSIVILQIEGGWSLLRTKRPGLHLLRAGLVVIANLAFYAALVSMPLAKATALYFVAPLLVTLLSIPVLGEKVGPRRGMAVLVGFVGVLVMLWPQLSGSDRTLGWTVLLPMLAAAGYAGMSVLTRKLGGGSRASAMAIYIQTAFMITSLGFYLIAGDGRFVHLAGSDATEFLLRPWIWPPAHDWPSLLGLGLLSAAIGYCMSQAYRLGEAASVAPFEYVLMIFAVFWGWTIFGEWPGHWVLAGATIIICSGAYVAWRAGQKQRIA